MLDAGCWILDAGCWIPDAGYLVLDVFWMQDGGKISRCHQHPASSIQLPNLPLPSFHSTLQVDEVCETILLLQSLDGDLATDAHLTV